MKKVIALLIKILSYKLTIFQSNFMKFATSAYFSMALIVCKITISKF